MAKSLTASKQVMKNYLSELLTEEAVEQALQPKPEAKAVAVRDKQQDQKLEKLLAKVDEVKAEKTQLLSRKHSIDSAAEHQPITTAKSAAQPVLAKPQKAYREGSFQALFFDVAGLTVAVPLIELGGIHNVDKITPLMGKPEWFSGVMVHRDEKVNVVDTAQWVMPEKCDQKLKNSLNYQYIIMLNDSAWGLSAEQLVDTVNLNQEDVKWLDTPSKRPWLAGLVKDRKCALLEVDALIELLSEGAGIDGFIKS